MNNNQCERVMWSAKDGWAWDTAKLEKNQSFSEMLEGQFTNSFTFQYIFRTILFLLTGQLKRDRKC